MNRNLIWGIIAILIIGGVIIWGANNMPDETNETANTPSTSGEQENTSTGTNERTPGVAVATTKAATFLSRSTAVLNGEVNPNGAQTSYRYEYGATNSLGTLSSVQLIGGGYTKYSAPLAISNLSVNTTYYYRIVTENQFGKTNGTILSFTTTDTSPQTLEEPTAETRSATSVTRNSAVLGGATNPKGSTTSYWFEYGRSTSLGNSTTVGNAGAGTANAVVSGQISGLETGTTYYYRLNAQNEYGIDNGNIFSFTTESANPAATSGDRPEATTEAATNINKAVATIRGQVDPNGSATTYYFEYGKATLLGLFSLVDKTEAKSAGSGTATTSVSSPITSLEADTTYHYRLVAENENGTSMGAIHSFTTKK